MLDHTQVTGDPSGGVQLRAMALAIVEAHGVAAVALGLGHGYNGGRIEAARQQDYRAFLSHVLFTLYQRPGSSFHSSLCNCSWKRTGRLSATIQSARSLALTWWWLGENNTSPARSARLYWISLETAQS
ncbi:hypothetical protein D3C80_1761780 [compost metagenome]